MSQSVRNHIEGNTGQGGGGGNNRRGGPPPGNGGNGGTGGPPPGGNGRGGGPPPGGNGRGDGPPHDGNDGGGRRGRPVSRGARNAAVPRRSNASARSDRSGPGPGPRRDPDSDEGASHFCYPTVNLMYTVHSLGLELWDAVSMPPSALATEPGLPSAQSSLSSSRAPQTLQRSVTETEPSISVPQNCKCGKPAVEFTVRRDTGNIGRRFRRCGQPNDCGYFEWVDELPQKDQAKRSRTPNPHSIPAKRARTDDAVRISDYGLRTYRRTLEERF